VGHYAIGIALAVAYVAGTRWPVVAPDALPIALGYGFATNAFPCGDSRYSTGIEWMAFRLALLAVALLVGTLACQQSPRTASPSANAGNHSSRLVPTVPPSAPSAEASTSPASSSQQTAPVTTRITISTPATQYQLGTSLELRVEYKNVGGQVLRITEPQKTWELLLRVKSQSDERSAPFGRLFHTDYNGIERTVVEDAKIVTLAPGSTHAFTEDIGKRWLSLFEPGRCVVSVKDRKLNLESNELSLEIVLARVSISSLLDVLAQSSSPPDPHRSSSEDGITAQNREFAAEWVRRFYPELAVELPPPDPAAEARNQSSVRAARAFWQQNQEQPAVLKKIVELNRASSGAVR
jgi:hypothetical protein